MLEDYVSKGKDKRYCLNCHAPQSVVFPDLVDSMVKQIISGDLTFEGVGCIQRHLIKAVDPNVKGHPSVKLKTVRPGSNLTEGWPFTSSAISSRRWIRM